jgi:hypothetical protein
MERLRNGGIRGLSESYQQCKLDVGTFQYREEIMKKSLILAALLAFTTPALASQCPALMNKIDEAMKTAQVDDATKQQVMDLYNKGKAAHDAGDHAASEASLNEALKLLGM